MIKYRFLAEVFIFLFLAGVCATQAGTKTWKAATTGDWFAAANWVENAYPTNGDDVVITNTGASVLLTNSTEYLSSIMISNTATLVFSNWNTKLSATNVYVWTNATVTLPAAFTTIAGIMSNNVYIVCSNLTIAAGGKIDADTKGYKGGIIGSSTKPGYGPGAGSGNGAGSYGGMGYSGGPTYGSSSAPIDPGSGSGTLGDIPGGSGGGAIRIQAGSLVTIDGIITANGETPSGRSGGSGGSIYITTRSLGGNNGIIRANGAKGGSDGGGGGGGRIAIVYDSSAQSLLPVPNILFSAAGNMGGANVPALSYYSDIGTLYFPDDRFWRAETISHSGQVIVPGFTNWAPNNLTISNGWVRFPWDAFQITVTNAVTVIGTNAGLCKLEVSRLTCGGPIVLTNGSLVIKGVAAMPILNCGGSLALNNVSTFTIYSVVSNAFGLNYGALVSIVGDVTVATNSWIYPYSNPTNGGSPLFCMRNLTIAAGGGIDADTKGYAGRTVSGAGYGPGRGSAGIGAGYGGPGYGASGSYGQTYGSSNMPVDPGSGSGSYGDWPGGYGGGEVRIQARMITLNGTITANGQNPGPRPGGSGGGIYLTIHTLAGINGIIRADGGGSTQDGGGGGGRIAIWRVMDAYSGFSITVNGGSCVGPKNGSFGTIVWGQLPPPGTVFFGH